MTCLKLGAIVIAGLLTVSPGCASDRRPAQSDAAMVAPASQLDDAKEPAINARTRFAAGQLAESQGNIAAAIKQYEEAIKIDAQFHPALYRLGLTQTKARQFSAAIATWKRYLEVTGPSAGAYSNLGFCYELAGKRADAEAAYTRGIAADPANEPCRVNYGLMLARAGRIVDATAQLQAVLTPAEVAYNLASVYEQQGNKEQAKAHYRKALALDAEFKDARERLAKLE